MGLTPVGCFGAVPDAEISISTFRYLSTPALDSQRGVFGSPYPRRRAHWIGRSALSSIRLPPKQKSIWERICWKIDVEEEIAVVSAFFMEEEEDVKIGKRSRLRRTLKLPYRSVLKFVAPDFQSDMPKVRKAVEGRQDPVGAQPFDGIPPPRRRGMEWGMRCVGSDSRPDRLRAAVPWISRDAGQRRVINMESSEVTLCVVTIVK
ncbi:hypothetical protein J6590_091754 [Homalodisca vitripennis]|nr:hypothetical protein J6590_091754 [Homalodisca vitripennis]